MRGIFSIRESSISLSSDAAGIAAYDDNKTQCCRFRSKARLPACPLLFSLLFATIIDTPCSHAENFTAICEASALSTCDLRSSKKSTLAPIRERARLFESRGARCQRDRVISCCRWFESNRFNGEDIETSRNRSRATHLPVGRSRSN